MGAMGSEALQVVGIFVMLLCGLFAVMGTLVLLRNARAWETAERAREDLEDLVADRREERRDVRIEVRPAYQVVVCTRQGRTLEAFIAKTAPPEQLASGACARLRTAENWPRAGDQDDGPPSGTRSLAGGKHPSRAQLAAASAESGHAAKSLTALQAYADVTVAEMEAEERARAQRRAGSAGTPAHRGFAHVVSIRGGGSNGAQGHAS